MLTAVLIEFCETAQPHRENEELEFSKQPFFISRRDISQNYMLRCRRIYSGLHLSNCVIADRPYQTFDCSATVQFPIVCTGRLERLAEFEWSLR